MMYLAVSYDHRLVDGAQAVGFSITYLLVGTYLTALVGFVAWLANPAKLRE